MRIPRLGVAFRIFAGLIVICSLSAITSIVALSLFARFDEAFDQIAASKLPGLISASQLAQQSGTIAANAPALAAVQSQSAREAVMARINDQIMILEDMMVHLYTRGTDMADLSELERRKDELVKNLARLNTQVERQLDISTDTGTLVTQLVGLSGQVQHVRTELLDGTFDDGPLRSGPLPPSRPGGGQENPAFRHAMGWHDAANQAIIIMLASTRADHEAKVERMRREFREALERAARHLTKLPPHVAGRLEPLHRELSTQGLGERNIFASRMAEMALHRTIKSAVTRNQNVSDRLVAAVSDYFFAVEQDVNRRSAEFERVIKGGERAIVATALLSILGAAAIFAYIHRNVVRRLRALQAAMVAHEAGKSVAIPTHGRDEIGDMARALKFFVTTIQAREQDLSESEGRLRAILEQSPVGVLITRADGTVAFANSRAAELAGVPLEVFVGNRHALAPGIDAMPGNAAGNVEVALDRPDGSRVWALQTIQRTEFEGEPAMLAWSYDITKRKRAEKQLRAAKEQAEVAARSKSEFLATMSHEIRTPMNGVLGMLELIALTPLDGEQQALVTTVRDSATALLRIIDDILDLSKIEAGKLDLEELEINPTELLEGVADLLAPQASQKGLTLICDADPAMPAALCGDPGRLRQILFNLAGNAIKFTEAGRVVLRARPDPDRPAPTPEGRSRVRLRFEVEDTGIGISEAGQARLFKPFSQADSSTTRQFGGTGLGLAICARLVEMMGGAIGVSSVPERGSTFWFTVDLPVGDGTAGDGAGDRPPHDGAADLSGLSIVVAEGDAVQRTVLIHYLESRQAAVLGAADAEEAVELATLGDADLLVLSVGLPGGAPAEVLSRIAEHRAQEGGHPPPCLLLADGRDQLMERVDGSIDHMSRPIHRDALLQRVAALAGRARPIAPGRVAETLPIPAMGAAAGSAADEALILVAEDHPTNREVIRRQLRQLGFEADLTADGVEALAAWRTRPYRLLITDCHMPRMDGYELARRIRDAERERATGDSAPTGIPIIAMTANALAGEMERCRDAGMSDYLAKPVTLKQLACILDRWLRKEAPATPGETAAPATPEPDPPVLCIDHVRETVGGLDAAALDMLDAFVRTSRRKIEQAALAWTVGDREAALSAAHATAGAARTAGAKRLAEACSALERAIAQADDEAAARSLEAMRRALPPLAAAIRDLRHEREEVG